MKLQHDGNITIATVRNRMQKAVKNKTMAWSEFLAQLSSTTRTRETEAEYRKMAKLQQDETKDVGAYIGGWFKNGKRRTDNLEHRSLITLDADFATAELFDDFELLFGNAAAVHSTHKHTEANPRLRLIIPLSRTISGDEYQAVSRKLAETLGIDLFDDTTYQPTRLMYWPSTSQDGEYFFRYCDGAFLNPDELLSLYPDWRDASYWPESSRCANVRVSTAKKQGNPHEKPGVVGAFCRCYDIEEAISTFLKDSYTECSIEGRYTYTKGSTAAGLVLYDDGMFAYSNHASDPASGRLCNSFDLVRLHLYGHEDEDAAPDTPVNRLPSYTKMMELARNDSNVKHRLTDERLKKARKDFDLPAEDDGKWMEELTVNRKGEPESTINNVCLILTNDALLKGTIAFNSFKDRLVAVKPLPWREVRDSVNGDTWTDADDSELRRYLELGYTITGKDRIADAVTAVSRMNSIHPIRDYLDSLKWDGVGRLERLLIDYLGAQDTPYVRAVTRKAFTAAVARIFNPGCKFDYILVISGPQGRGKSTLIFKMACGWYTDSLAGIGTKEAYEGIQGYWLIELAELAAMKKMEIETIKNFISKQVDSYRAAYGRRVEDHPRQCVFFGTTNSTAFLRDDTGNRRFWPVRLEEDAPKYTVWNDLTQEVINQLWAEAVHLYRSGESLTLSDDLESYAREQQTEFTEDDPRAGIVEDYLEVLLPKDWNKKSIDDRRSWFQEDESMREDGTEQRQYISAVEVWAECFNNDPGRFPRQERNEIISLLRKLAGWQEEIKRQRCGDYGRQKRFFRE